MPTLTRRRRGGPRFPVDRHTIGNADVVFPKERLTSAARSLALALPAYPDNDVVVVDLPVDTPIAAWESVAEVLPRRRRGVRLVLGGRARETTALAGQWLSERLRRTVVAPDGAMVHGGTGAGMGGQEVPPAGVGRRGGEVLPDQLDRCGRPDSRRGVDPAGDRRRAPAPALVTARRGDAVPAGRADGGARLPRDPAAPARRRGPVLVLAVRARAGAGAVRAVPPGAAARRRGARAGAR